MNEKISKFIDPIKSFWQKLTPKIKKFVIFGALGIVVGCIILAIILNQPRYVVLYPGLDQAEALEIVKILDESQIDYKFDDKTGTISIQESQEESMRMELANKGYPKSGPNYDFFLNNIDIMTTDSEKRIIEQYQLNQRLAAVIRTINTIQNAEVTISIADSDGYVLSAKDRGTTTAGVTVTLISGATLTSEQVMGIKKLISSSVPSLKPENVVVVNTATGVELGSDNVTQVDMESFRLAMEMQYEQEISNKIRSLLVPMFGGEKNVTVAVTCHMDINKKVQEIITYIPSENNKGVESELTVNNEATVDGTINGGIPGTTSNTEIPTYPDITVDGNTIHVKNEASYKYLVSQVKEQIQKDAGELDGMTISVAVNAANMDANRKAELTKLIAFASNVDPEKVMVFNSAFPMEPQVVGPPITKGVMNILEYLISNPLLMMIAGGAILVLVLMILFFVILSSRRKRKIKKMLADQAAAEEAMALSLAQAENAAKEAEINFDDLHNIKDTKEQQLKKELQDFSAQNPEIAAQLIRTWLKGGDE